MHEAFLAHLDRCHPSIERTHHDVAGVDLAELEHRLDGEVITFSLAAGSWSAMSLTGEYSAHGDNLFDVVDELLEQLPPTPQRATRHDVVHDGSAFVADLRAAA